MRTIKFRGLVDGNWWYATPDCDSWEQFWVLVDRKTVGQSTGLLDKKGKEVFEGSLLRLPPKEDWDKTNYVIYEVFFHDNDCADKHIGFQMNRHHYQGSICGTSNFYNFLPKYVKKMEIIGDIHQNPDLL